MKKDTKDTTDNKAQTGEVLKKDLPIKNSMTNAVKNTALQTEGLNQAKITRDDLLPSDGDNLTNT